jgi:hypothetical protein
MVVGQLALALSTMRSARATRQWPGHGGDALGGEKKQIQLAFKQELIVFSLCGAWPRSDDLTRHVLRA